MIRPVSQANVSFGVREEKKERVHSAHSTAKTYADSFLKHSKESVPTLAAITGVWSVIEGAGSFENIKRALFSNIKGFFLPVLVVTSAILAYVENKNN